MQPDVAKMMSSHSGYVTAHRNGGDLTSDQLKQSFNDAFSKQDIANIKWFANISSRTRGHRRQGSRAHQGGPLAGTGREERRRAPFLPDHAKPDRWPTIWSVSA